MNFPLSRDMIDPSVNLFHPNKCGQLHSFDEDTLGSSGCLEDKTIVVIGDSRARQIGGHLGIMMRKTHRVKE